MSIKYNVIIQKEENWYVGGCMSSKYSVLPPNKIIS